MSTPPHYTIPCESYSHPRTYRVIDASGVTVATVETPTFSIVGSVLLGQLPSGSYTLCSADVQVSIVLRGTSASYRSACAAEVSEPAARSGEVTAADLAHEEARDMFFAMLEWKAAVEARTSEAQFEVWRTGRVAAATRRRVESE